MKLFIFILLSFCFLNSHLVYASDLSLNSNQEQAQMLEQAQKSVWQIEYSLEEGGTGFFISPNELVTNFHVVADLLKDNSDDFVLSQKDNQKTLKVKKVKHLSPRSDLVILEIEGEVSDYLSLAQKNPHSKENLFLVGYPNGKFKIIDKTYDIYYEDEFEYTYAVKHGHYGGVSGSPVLNSKGEVVGIAQGGNEVQMNAIKIIHLKNLLKQDSPSFKNPKDHLEHSIKELEQVAESGDMIAQFRLGIMYAMNLGVEEDIEEATRWFREAAEQGHAKAQLYLSVAYEEGLGVEEDLKEAARWLRKAAEQKFAPAQYNLGFAYEDGLGVKKDLEEAALWFEKAAEQGFAPAQFHLGLAYEEGRGVEKDPEEAIRWFRESAEQGYMKARLYLGVAGEEGRDLVKYFEEAAR